MSQRTSARHARLLLEQLEDRCTPSAALSNPPVHAPAPPHLAAAHTAGAGQHAVPIQLSALITSDGSGVLNLTGNGSHLGRWTGQGTIDNVVSDANEITVSATVTVVAANGDQLFISVAVSLNRTTGLGEETITVTGGTGRFAAASGRVDAACNATLDPASLIFTCNSQGSGSLVLVHA